MNHTSVFARERDPERKSADVPPEAVLDMDPHEETLDEIYNSEKQSLVLLSPIEDIGPEGCGRLFPILYAEVLRGNLTVYLGFYKRPISLDIRRFKEEEPIKKDVRTLGYVENGRFIKPEDKHPMGLSVILNEDGSSYSISGGGLLSKSGFSRNESLSEFEISDGSISFIQTEPSY